MAIFREIGDYRGIGVTLGNLGRSAIARGDLDQAAAHHAEALARHRDVGYKWGEACELDRLAEVCRRQGDLARTRALYGESLRIWRAIDDPVELAVWLDQFAELELASEHPAAALGAAHALRHTAGHAEVDASTRAEVACRVRDALGEEAFRAAWEGGRSQPIGEVLDRAVAALSEPAASAATR